MWTTLVLICFIASFDIGTSNDSSQPQTFIERPSSIETRPGNLEDPQHRLPRKFKPNSPTQRLHIKNQTGFDGKVDKININSEEDLPGIRAYGMPKKHLMNNGYIERIVDKEIREELDDAVRVARLVSAYGKSKEHLETNGRIESIHPAASHHSPSIPARRVTRAIETKANEKVTGSDLFDLEAQDAKVFRPLFVYRQQMAKKHRAKNNLYQPSQNRFFKRSTVF